MQPPASTLPLPLPTPEIGSLLRGAQHFLVEELPAYEPCGEGEHVYVLIEKRGLTTDAAVKILAQASGIKPRAVGFAGRKDRHAITRQWLSLQFADRESLEGFTYQRDDESIRVLTVSQHRNKLRLGHLRGNRFGLAVTINNPEALPTRCEQINRNGLRNHFGAQRFGINQANLTIAKAWGVSDWERAAAAIIDPTGQWQWGDASPAGFMPGDGGRVLGAIRQGRNADAAVRAAGRRFQQLIASAAQSAIFNAIISAREQHGLLTQARLGDALMTPTGAVFEVDAESLPDANHRLAAGELVTTGPLPGHRSLPVSATVSDEEQAWSASTGIDWSWLGEQGTLNSPGERRAAVVRSLEPISHSTDAPSMNAISTTQDAASDAESDGQNGQHDAQVAASDSGDQTAPTWLTFALPPGCFATQVLAELGIQVPETRRST